MGAEREGERGREREMEREGERGREGEGEREKGGGLDAMDRMPS